MGKWILLLALGLSVSVAGAVSVTAQGAAPADSTSGPALLERLQSEDDAFYGNEELFEFDESYKESLVTTIDSLGLEAFEDSAAKAIPVLTIDPTVNWGTLDYNRVDGFVLGAGVEFGIGRRNPGDYRLEGAYATGTGKFRYLGSADIPVWGNRSMEVSARGFYRSKVVAYGSNRVTLNGLRAFVGGSDDQNYVWRRGGAASVRYRHDDWGRVDAGYSGNHERSADATTSFALFGKMSPVNANVAQGMDQAVFLALRLGSLSERRWRLDATHRVSGGAMGGDFNYNAATFDFRFRRYLIGRQEVMGEIKSVVAAGDAPVQRVADAGGITTVRGYGLRAIEGMTSLALRLEYLVPYDFLGMAGIPLRLQFVPWGDAARVWEGTSDEWIGSAGLGIQYYVGPFGPATFVRLDVAAPLGPDRPDDVKVLLHFTQATF